MIEKQRIQPQRIKNITDLAELKIGHIVEIIDKGRRLYYAASMDSYTFLGRVNGDSIEELEVARGNIIPLQNGNIGIGAILSGKIYHNFYPGRDIYESKDNILRETGL